MAEAMEFNFTLPKTERQPIAPEIVEQVRELQQEQDGKERLTVPEKYRLKTYYAGDSLGADVLKNKYLAPWENHPWDIWQRQAQAIASVESTAQLR